MTRTELVLYTTGGLLTAGAVAWWWYSRSGAPSGERPEVPEPQPSSRPPKPLPLSAELWAGIQEIAGRLEMDPRHLAAVMAFESRLNPSARNPYSGATGLIQFMPSTAARLGTTTAALSRMSALEQLPIVERYFAGFGGPFDTLQSVAMTVFYPKYRNVGQSTPFPADVQKANPGIKTPADYLARVLNAARAVLPPEPEPEPAPVIEVLEATPSTPVSTAAEASPLPTWVPEPLRAAQSTAYQLGVRAGKALIGSEGIPHVRRTI